MISWGVMHIIPDVDLIEHETEINSSCACGPEVYAVERKDGSLGWVYIHHVLTDHELQAPAGGGNDHA